MPRWRSERDFWRFADAHLRGYFPDLVGQSQLNRRIRSLEPELRAFQRDLAATLADSSDVYHVLDTTLIPGLSCHRFISNQFRLLLHAAAYWLLDTLRRKLEAVGVKRMQLDTLRLRILKIGGRVKEMLTKVLLYLASGHPSQHLWEALSSDARAPS